MEAAGQLTLLAFVGTASYWDLRLGIIPNWLTVSGALAGVLWAAFLAPAGPMPWLGAGLGVGCLAFLYAAGGAGGGDVKMMAGFGLLAGYPGIVHYLFFALLAAVLLIVTPLAWRGELTATIGQALAGKKSARAEGADAGEKPARLKTSFALALLLGMVWTWVVALL